MKPIPPNYDFQWYQNNSSTSFTCTNHHPIGHHIRINLPPNHATAHQFLSGTFGWRMMCRFRPWENGVFRVDLFLDRQLISTNQIAGWGHNDLYWLAMTSQTSANLEKKTQKRLLVIPVKKKKKNMFLMVNHLAFGSVISSSHRRALLWTSLQIHCAYKQKKYLKKQLLFGPAICTLWLKVNLLTAMIRTPNTAMVISYFHVTKNYKHV